MLLFSYSYVVVFFFPAKKEAALKKEREHTFKKVLKEQTSISFHLSNLGAFEADTCRLRGFLYDVGLRQKVGKL